MFVDNLAIPAKAPNAALAHKFINYILDPQVGANSDSIELLSHLKNL